MNKPEKNKKQTPKKSTQEWFPGPILLWVMLLLSVFYMMHAGSLPAEKSNRQFTYGEFYSILRENNTNLSIKSAIRVADELTGELTTGEKYRVTLPDRDPDLERFLRENVKNYEIRPEKTFWAQLLYAVIGPVILVGLLWFMSYRGGGAGGGGRIMAFGRSKAKLSNNVKITFKDVAGVEEAKEELKEIIEFLKDPKKFQRLGGKIPKGVLLMGPPGTGKTLLAKAVSGEADVPFFSISGSDFVEMFVGVGASRVRDLFDQAKRSVKQTGRGCILFIDEIDAVGRQRFAGIGGGHDEREQTLNALLVEMDGFNTSESIILIAATNRPDVLDSALLRPGRFDRQVIVPLPDLIGREAILKVHAAKVKLDPVVDLMLIAKQTTYFSGADLANLVNEGALLAARLNKESVGMSELQESIERVMAGPQRKSKKVSEREKKIVAFHESGHALVGLLTPNADPLHKITIIPRGMAGGYTVSLPEEERTLHSLSHFQARLPVMMGGRVAEEIVFGDITTGAYDDLQKATELARNMVCHYGMSPKLGPMIVGKEHNTVFLGRDLGEERNYSDETARVIDSEIKRILDEAYERARKIIAENRDKLDMLSSKLIEKETLDSAEVRVLLSIPEMPAAGALLV